VLVSEAKAVSIDDASQPVKTINYKGNAVNAVLN
jgi:hypothetical protein